jgi:chemotaxis protein MotA
MAATKKSRGGHPDFATIAGVAIALGGILGGMTLEHGKLGDITQLTATLIVLGGTFGATLVSTPLPLFMRAVKRLKSVFIEPAADTATLAEQLIEYATKARKHGVLSLEEDADRAGDPFVRKSLMLAVDGLDLQEIRRMMETDMAAEEHAAEAEAKVFEVAGGYSPTIGIIGAVLGLIQVMKQIQDVEAVGKGIAVAFVATIYGVALANIVLLPAAAKIKARARQAWRRKELVVEGISGIVVGLNPKLLRSKLECYVEGGPKRSGGKGEKAVAEPVAEAVAQ